MLVRIFTGGWLGHGREWIFSFIESYMTRDIYSTRGRLKALISTLRQRVANENTWHCSVLEFVWRIGVKPWETETAECTELLVVWWCLKEFLKRGVIGEDRCG